MAKDPAKAETYYGPTAPKPQPYSGGTATPHPAGQPGGFDLSGPSAQESAYSQYGGQLGQKGATENFVGQNAGALAGPGRTSGVFGQAQPALAGQSAQERFLGTDPNQQSNATASGQYWNSLQGGANLPAANMDAYYKRAQEKGAAQLDKAAAARGMFGSTAALDQQRQLSADLGAAQSQAEAQYGLQRAGLADQIMGGAAGRADTSGLGRFNAMQGAAQGADAGLLARLGLSGQLGATADAGDLSRFGAGLGAAQASDQSMLGRLGLLGQGAAGSDAGKLGRTGMFADQLGNLTAGASGIVGQGYAGMLGADQEAFDQATQLSLGAGAQNLNNAISNTNTTAAQGAGLQATGAAADQSAANIYGLLSGSGK